MMKKPLFYVFLGIFSVLLMSSASPRLPKKPAPPATTALAANVEPIWVFKKDGSQSCGLMPGDSIEGAKTQLEKAGVKVIEARKQSDGKMHIQMCGADTGQVNQFKIDKKDLTKAIALGYQLQK